MDFLFPDSHTHLCQSTGNLVSAGLYHSTKKLLPQSLLRENIISIQPRVRLAVSDSVKS